MCRNTNQFKLGIYEYKSKEELKRKLKKYLQSAPDGIISNPNSIDKLHYLILLHPNADRKIGCGIKYFAVEKNYLGSGKSFKIIREDGTEERFSYKSCIDGQIVTNKSKVIEALRFSVRPQIIEYRHQIPLPTKCALSGRMIRTNEELHIDHKIPFWMLINQFCRKYSIDIDLLKTEGNGEELKLKNDEIKLAFQKFHEDKAQLQPTLKSENFKKGSRLEKV